MAECPTETITFLFTDIEGSTRLWEQHPDAMRRALARHDALVSAALAAHGGHLFKTAGDAFCAAFTSAPAALAAALDASRSLRAQTWGETDLRRVRFALYAGAALRSGGDYLGPSLGRAARLLAAAHGGQILLSESAADALGDALPGGASLRELGLYRLKELQAPERIFQLLHPDFPAEFPPLRSLEAFAHNLPRPLTSFVGRGREIEEVKQRLQNVRLLTLTGTGGCGKTRLALQVAADLLDSSPDGVWWIPLESLSDPTLLPRAIGDALGIREEGEEPLLDLLIDTLRPRDLLLVLDNCEHLLAGTAALVETLLQSCPRLRILATSRETLALPGETTYRVPALRAPPPRERSVDRLLQYEAVQLLVDRIGAARPGFALADENAAAVAQICHRLEGIPLAIELAAARAGSLPVEELARRLGDWFLFLGKNDALPRQQTLQATMEWSYGLLSEPERTLLRRLSVFAGGFTLEAAEAVCGEAFSVLGSRWSGNGESNPTSQLRTENRGPTTPFDLLDVLDLLTGLVEKSLVLYEEAGADAGRYRLMEIVRRYAGERLAEAGEEEWARARHREWFAVRAEQIGERLESPNRALAWRQVETEYANLRAALEGCPSDEAGREAAVRLLRALGPFWFFRGHVSEGRETLSVVRARIPAGRPTAATAQLALEAGLLARQQGDGAAATALYEEALRCSREIGDGRRVAIALENLGYVALRNGDLPSARSWFEEALSIFRSRESEGGGVAGALQSLGHVARFEGRFTEARALYEEALEIGRGAPPGYRNPVGHALLNLGHLARLAGEFGRARENYEQSARQFAETGDQEGMAFCLEGMACLAASQGDAERAAQLLGAAETVREEAEIPLPSVDRAGYEASILAARRALGEARFAAAWAAGRALPPEDALARETASPEAHGGSPPPGTDQKRP